MSLATNIQNFATRVATEIKSVRTLVNGNTTDLSALQTAAKGNLVAAVNEVNGKIGQAGAQIDDATPRTTTVYSSSKTNSAIAAAVSGLVNGAGAALDTFKELQDALGGDANYAQTVATALGNRVRYDAAQTPTSAQQAQARSNIDTYSTAQVGDPTTDFVAAFVAGLS